MKSRLLPSVMVLCVATACLADESVDQSGQQSAGISSVSQDCVVLPDPTNGVQFRLYTNAAPDSPHLFNTFDIEADGETLLKSPGGNELRHWLASSPSNASLHNVLINGEGPELAPTNNSTVTAQAAGPGWRYMALNLSPAYHGKLDKFERAIVFVEPDLFVLYDHLVAKQPVRFQMMLHPPAATRLDPDWHDLHLDVPNAGMTIHSPGRRRDLRPWERVKSVADVVLPGTVTMELGPTNKLAELRVLTVFAVRRGGEKRSYAFKLLESSRAIGAQIHRDGLPTIVAFNTETTGGDSSLTGFQFNGPVGVYVFKPKQKPDSTPLTAADDAASQPMPGNR